MKTCFFFVILSILPSFLLNSQNKIELSSKGINGIGEYNHFIFCDSYGITWISGSHHLNSFDGNIIKSHLDNIKGNWIQGNIVEDHSGNIWTATYEHLLLFNRNSQDFSYHQLSVYEDTLKEYYHIIEYDSLTNLIWLKADEKLVALNPEDISISSILPINTHSRRYLISRDSSGEWNIIYGIPMNEFEGLEIIQKNKNHNICKHILFPEKYKSNNPFYVYDCVNLNNEYYFTSNYGLFEIRDTTIRFLTSEPLYNIETCDSEIIATTHNGHLISYNTELNIISQEIDSLREEGKEINAINNIENVLWLSYDAFGVNGINHIRTNSRFAKIPASGKIKSIEHQKKNTSLLVDDTIFFYEEGEYNQIIDFIITDGNTEQIIIDKKDNIWAIGLHSFQLYDYKNRSWVENPNISFDQINSISLNNNKLIISSTAGTFEIIQKGESFHLIEIQNNINEGDHHEAVLFSNNALLYSPDGINLSYSRNSDVTSLPFEGYIYSMKLNELLDKAYISSSTGLYIVDTFMTVTKFSNSLEYNLDWEVYETGFQDDNLIIKSNIGLFTYSYIDNKLLRFSDYRLENPSSSIVNSIEIDSKGDIILLEKGQLYLCENSMPIQEHPQKLNLDELDISNLSSLKTNFVEGRINLDLLHNQNQLKVIASFPDYTNSDFPRIIYILKTGKNEEQNILRNGEAYDLFSLSPGKYNLELKAYNSNNINVDTANIFITISPPYYATWWFRSASVFSLLGLGFGINYNITRRKLKQAQIQLEKQEALSAQREKIADDLHDELGTDLSRILYLSDEAGEIDDDKKKDEIIEDITSLATSSIRNMRDILWVLDEKNDGLSNLINRIRTNASQLFSEQHIHIDFDLRGQEDFYNVSSEVRQQVLLIAKEACHNIIKHANATIVSISTNIERENWSIRIIDNGLGMRNTEPSKGRGLHSMHRRSEKISAQLEFEANNPIGTIITLKIPLNLFESKDKKV